MKFSEFWLREWVNPTLNSAALSEQITMAGLKVDAIKSVADDFHGVVIGEIVNCYKDIHNTKVNLTKINIGNNKLLNIICDAINCREGMKVVVATTGIILPSSRYKIISTTIYGIVSEGILCSFGDLGINNDFSKIIELPINAPIGIDIRNYLQLDDKIIEISVTSNRGDALSILGIAREIAALNILSLNIPNIESVTVTTNETCAIFVDATIECPRYLCRIIKNINLKVLTPLWMQEKLRRSGIHSINPLVDITNYVLLELGQPMHVFDVDCIEGEIVVRMAQEDENFISLDGTQIKLNKDTLVLADQHKILAISGICGGKYSGIQDNTKNILIECAFFNPLAISGRARRYGLYTDASCRYEHGVDPELQYKAIERATQLLVDICGGKVGPIVNRTQENHLPKQITIILRHEKLNLLLGYRITEEQVTDILKRLGYEVAFSIGAWRVIVPSWRFDIQLEEDLIQEVARVYGYNNIPKIPLTTNLTMTQHCETNLSLNRVKNMLVDKGYQEAITYSFVDPKMQQLLYPEEKTLIILNPISHEMSAMRLSLLIGLLSAVVYNQKRQQRRVRLFESGLRFIVDSQSDLGVRQEFMLAGVLSGNRYKEHWDIQSQEVDFYDLKGDLESILDLTGKLEEISFCAEANPALHPGQSAAIYLSDERIGFIGVIHPELEGKLSLNGCTVVFELLWDKIIDRILPNACAISRFPANRRDIAIVVSEHIPAAQIIAECKKVCANQLVNINLFDVYRGKGVNKGKKSLAISLILQDTSRTLEEEEIAAIVNKCIEALQKQLHATLRN
ncbi:phenylalanine--tRNA ligase subunit beta [Pantoea sp. Aalb]|uniref:phenylalanine--tRNA ligase subunit beta n=1 Tax=Pantoea sp. Aalb TaxID=2576762 RepID=UPI0013221F3A|nr:phenylalanine--tRNA ligase subunit beta [Pantoea sp. Aalb]MXP67433.1 phenylalanine--tRNA ligase subunit beta [Pantoea sp. Aalb]